MKELVMPVAGTVVLFVIPPPAKHLGEALAKRRPMSIPRFRSHQPPTKTLENLT